MDGRKRGFREATGEDVVETGDSDVLRDADAPACQRLEDADRHLVVCADDRIGQGLSVSEELDAGMCMKHVKQRQPAFLGVWCRRRAVDMEKPSPAVVVD